MKIERIKFGKEGEAACSKDKNGISDEEAQKDFLVVIELRK